MCKTCDYADTLAQIDTMLDDDTFEFASDTLSGIRTWVADNEHATEQQKIAIENIRDGGERYEANKNDW